MSETISELLPGISAAELEIMQESAAAFLESQGTAAGREMYDWPGPGRPHFIDALSDEFSELTRPFTLHAASGPDRYDKKRDTHFMYMFAEGAEQA